MENYGEECGWSCKYRGGTGLSSISGNTIFIVVALVLATMVFANTLNLTDQGVVEREMLKYRTEELAMNLEMIDDFQNTGYMEIEFSENFTFIFNQNTVGDGIDNAYDSKLTLEFQKKSHTAGVGVELEDYGSFNGSKVCIKQEYPPSDVRRLSMTNEDFVRKYIIEKIREACGTSGLRNFPPGGQYSFSMNGVDEIRTDYHDEIGSDWMTVDLKYSDGDVNKYRIDGVGVWNSWKCTGNPGQGMYQFNGSTVGADGHDADSGTNKWVDIDSSKIQRWRVMEEEDNHYVNVQINQVDPADVPGNKKVELTKGECG